MSHQVYLALGTNLGDRLANLNAAIQALSPGVRVLRQSSIYETPPWGFADQPDFLNQVLLAETNLFALDLLAYLKNLESRLGRQSTFKFGPRLIDIDILFYDELVMETSNLKIPHPRISERAFVLVPLADLAAELRHPISGEIVREMLGKVDIGGIRRFDPEG